MHIAQGIFQHHFNVKKCALYSILSENKIKNKHKTHVVLLVCVELDVSEVQNDGHHLPDAFHGQVGEVEGSEGVHHHPEFG
jgi:hypothetical protein